MVSHGPPLALHTGSAESFATANVGRPLRLGAAKWSSRGLPARLVSATPLGGWPGAPPLLDGDGGGGDDQHIGKEIGESSPSVDRHRRPNHNRHKDKQDKAKSDGLLSGCTQ